MKILKDQNTLVILGAWNLNIFSLSWVKKYLFPDGELQIKLDKNKIVASPSFLYENIRLTLEGQRLILASMDDSDSSYIRLEETAYKLVDYLPHTPARAFGINFMFTKPEADSSSDFLKQFDTELLEDQDYKSETISLRRQFKLEDDILIYTVDKDASELKFNFNFHFDISDLASLKGKLNSGDISKKREHSISLLKNVYGYELGK